MGSKGQACVIYRRVPWHVVRASASGPAHDATPGVPAGSAPPPRAPPRQRRLAGWGAGTAIAVVVVVLTAALWTGARPSTVSGSGVPFSQAEATSVAAVVAAVGGSWTVLGAVGLDERTTSSVPTSNVSDLLGANCTASGWNDSALVPTLPVPVFSGSFASGRAPFWLVYLAPSAPGPFALVEVLNGSAIPLARVGGTGCAGGVAGDRSLPPATVDSPAVAETAWSADGQSWVQTDPNLTSLALAAFGGGSYSGVAYPGLWGIVYSPCNPFLGGTVEEPMFVAVLNLTTGAMNLPFTYHLDCP